MQDLRSGEKGDYKMTNKELRENYEKLVELKERSTIRLPILVSFAIVRNMKLMQPIYEDIIAARLEILRKHGNPMPDSPGYYSPKYGEDEIMRHELDALDSMVVENYTVQKILLTDLENLDLTIADMEALCFMLDGE